MGLFIPKMVDFFSFLSQLPEVSGNFFSEKTFCILVIQNNIIFAEITYLLAFALYTQTGLFFWNDVYVIQGCSR